ncbi:spermatogenesis-associated serine-rich protein 2 [Mactra antiquata]
MHKDSNSTITFDTRTKTVMADVVQDNIKEKVSSVREVVSGKSNNEIVLVLQFYDYDVEKTIQAYLEGGAKEALQQWQFSGTKPVKKKRNKKKNVNNTQASDVPRSPESVSSESGSAGSFMVNGEISREPVMNGILDHDISVTSKTVTNGPISSTYQVPNSTSIVPNSSITTTTTSSSSSSSTLPLDSSQKQPSTTGVKFTGTKEKSPSPQSQRQNHNHSNRQRTHSGSHGHTEGRDRTTSTSSVDSKSGKKHAHLGLERSAKDLHRQTVSLERLRLIFKEEIDKSHKRLKSVFDEIRARLEAREKLLTGQLDELKLSGDAVFSMRQGLASDLKVQIDRAERMNEDDLANLRVDIKHFVCDRKIDEDLAKTIRFMYDDKLTDDIYAFGEIVPLKCQYVEQRSSTVVTPSVSTEVNYKETSHISKPVVDNTSSNDSHKKVPVSHLDPTQTEEIAQLQRRLKHSLTLEGIPVETFPDRPASVPVSSTNNVTNINSKPRPESARRGTGRGRPRNDRPKQDGPKDDNRSSFNQAPGGERVILIGRKTGPQGSGRGGRGGRGRGRGRGGYYGGGRGQNYNNNDNASNSVGGQKNDQTSAGDSRDQSSSPGKPQRENSSNNRRGSGRGSGYRGRGNSSPSGSGSNTNRSSSSANEKKEG